MLEIALPAQPAGDNLPNEFRAAGAIIALGRGCMYRIPQLGREPNGRNWVSPVNARSGASPLSW